MDAFDSEVVVEECIRCSADVVDHLVNYRRSEFVLSCPDDTGEVMLGPHYGAAVKALEARCSESTAAAIWDEFAESIGPITFEHELFRIASKTHAPGDECSMCPEGFPVPCVDHGGGCEGFIHGTLQNVRKDRTYSGRNLPERFRVLWAYSNAGNRRYDDGLVLTARCDTCASPAGPSERSEAKRRLASAS